MTAYWPSLFQIMLAVFGYILPDINANTPREKKNEIVFETFMLLCLFPRVRYNKCNAHFSLLKTMSIE